MAIMTSKQMGIPPCNGDCSSWYDKMEDCGSKCKRGKSTDEYEFDGATYKHRWVWPKSQPDLGW